METPTNPELFYLEQSVKSKLFTITKGGKTGPPEVYTTWFGANSFHKMRLFRDWMNKHHQKDENLTADGIRMMYYTFTADLPIVLPS